MRFRIPFSFGIGPCLVKEIPLRETKSWNFLPMAAAGGEIKASLGSPAAGHRPSFLHGGGRSLNLVKRLGLEVACGGRRDQRLGAWSAVPRPKTPREAVRNQEPPAVYTFSFTSH